MSIHHTTEQLEAAHRDGNKITAIRIILRHLRAADPSAALGRASHFTTLYWTDPAAALDQIQSWSPELGF